VDLAVAGSALGRLASIQARLHAARSPAELFGVAVEIASGGLPFDRAVMLVPVDGGLTAASEEPVTDPASERLRRRAVAAPVPLLTGEDEAEYLRRPGRFPRTAPGAFPALRAHLGLGGTAVAAVIPEDDAVALLIVDRAKGPPTAEEHRTLDLLAHLVGLALERTVLRARLGEIERELRASAVARQAMLHEAIHAPIIVSPGDRRADRSLTLPARATASDDVRLLFTRRETEVANLMADGRSNKEIAERLHISPDTVKTYVTRILRKLNSTNRAGAVARYLTMAHPGTA
jgi:DNA-binding CsgD family transcriptional regulator/GAF domain-containing protein